MKTVIGVDIGGTHITSALINLENRNILPSSLNRAMINTSGTKEEIIQSWSACIQASKAEQKIDAICFAMPGPFNYEEGVSEIKGQSKYENLYGINVKDLLSERLSVPKQSIFMTNDAACFLQGEVYAGAAQNFSDSTVIGITLGTGLGSAIYKDGLSYSADMWCHPFKDSIAENYISTRWFVQQWNESNEDKISGVKDLTVKQSADKRVVAIFKTFADNLSEFLIDFVAKANPSAIIIGGNIAKAYQWFQARLENNINSKFPEITIKTAERGEEAQLLGAASCWLHQLKNSRG